VKGYPPTPVEARIREGNPRKHPIPEPLLVAGRPEGHELDEPPESFDAAVAVVSLHHVEPLPQSIDRLAALLQPGARLVVDEFDVDLLDERASAWWLDQNGHDKQPADHVAEMREHLYSVSHIREELAAWFDLGEPVPGAYFYRWPDRPELRDEEERLIAAGELPAVGTRFIAIRR